MHEWQYEGEYPPGLSIDKTGVLKEEQEPVENIVTWIYGEGSFVPCGKITEKEEYSIVSDYLGTPTHAFNGGGEKVWERELDIYGSVRRETGQKGLVPQLYQGQWVDNETGLAYNRFRYYDNENGNYISQDPIRLAGGSKLYGYVHDPNVWVDPFGWNAELPTVQNKINSILLEHLPSIQAIDPNAQVGYRGSAASGISKAHDPKISKPFNPNNFDVDAFIQSDYLANDPIFTNRRREASEIFGMEEIEKSIDKRLREVFPGLREEPFGFRIFPTHELDAMARNGDVQVRLNCH